LDDRLADSLAGSIRSDGRKDQVGSRGLMHDLSEVDPDFAARQWPGKLWTQSSAGTNTTLTINKTNRQGTREKLMAK